MHFYVYKVDQNHPSFGIYPHIPAGKKKKEEKKAKYVTHTGTLNI